LLVDWGGVLTSDVFESFRRFCELEGLDPDTVRERFRSDRRARELLVGLESGTLPPREFEVALADVLGVEAADLIDRMFAGARPNERMVEAVRKAHHAGIRTGLVSNSWGSDRYDREQLGQMFDAVVISAEVGMRKPTPEIYAIGAERIGLPPEACVFVDDLPFNLKPAAELGMATVHHTDTRETIAQLEQLLGLPLQ
jgi:putative hydrolase of the HAD superfamily